MQLRKLLSCLIIGVALASMPARTMSSSPSFTLTTTAKIGGSGDISWAITATADNGAIEYCGWDLVPIPMTGTVHVDFNTGFTPVDIYIYTYLKNLTLITNEVAINAIFNWCGTNPQIRSSDCNSDIAAVFSSGVCVFNKPQVRQDSFDVNLPPLVASESYYMIVVQFGFMPVNPSTATIILNGSPAVTISSPTVSAVSLTPFKTESLHFYTASPSAQPSLKIVHTTPTTNMVSYSTTICSTYSSLQMPQPTLSTNSQSNNTTPELALAVAAIAVIALGVLLLYSRRTKPQVTETTKSDTLTTTFHLPPSKNFCIECGSELPAKSRLCNNCGTEQP